MKQAGWKPVFLSDHRIILIILISCVGGWILSVPYEGQLVYSLADRFQLDSFWLLTGSLVMQILGLVTGGLLIRNIKASKRALTISIPVCILCTAAFLFPISELWVVSLLVCSMGAGVCIASCGFFIRISIVAGERYKALANILVTIASIKLLINVIVIYISAAVSIILLTAILGAAWYFSSLLPTLPKEEAAYTRHNKKQLILALLMLCVFISIGTIDFGIMIYTVTPAYQHISWLSIWYGLLPYAVAAMIMKRIPALVERNNMIYIALGMIGAAFILFMVLGNSLVGYLIVFTLMMAAWAIYDVFWWGMLGVMLDMNRNAAIVLGLGFSANALGVIQGKLIARIPLPQTEVNTTMISLAVICATIVLLPILHKSIAKLLPENRAINSQNELKGTLEVPGLNDTELLTEREKQVAGLLLKGRTSKLIASELFLSENTVKTHIKNIYAKMNVRSRAELFNRFDALLKINEPNI